MTKNNKTHAEMIREAVEEMGSAKPNSIMDFIRRKYPEIDVKEKSFRADIIGCTVNHSSSHHYPGMPKFLFYDIEKGTYRLNDEKLGNKTEIESSKSAELVQTHSKEEILELLKEENPLIQEDENYSQLIVVLETKKLRINLGIIKGEYYLDGKLENRGSLLLPVDSSNKNIIWVNLKEGESAFYGFTLDSREMKIPEKIKSFFSRSFDGATIQDFIPFAGRKQNE